MRQGFDNDKYIALQAEHIRNRIDQFGGKLYLEFGGKLFDDYHAARVLPGFEPDSKIRMLKQLVDDVEIIVVINANDIEKSKQRGDLGITYDDDVLRLMDIFRGMGFLVGSVVVTHYAGQPDADAFRRRLASLGITCYVHPPIHGYPYDIDHIVSDEGFGKNEYVETSRPLVVVTAPGPGSGKMATCLSQLYHEHKRGISGRLCQVRDVPHLEPAAEAPGEHRLRGGHGRPGRREHHRPLPPGSLRRDHRQLQPRRGDVPRAEGHDGAHLRDQPLSVPHRHGREHGGPRHRRRRRGARGGQEGDRAPLLPDGGGGAPHRRGRGPGGEAGAC